MIGHSSFLIKKYTPEELGVVLKLGGEKVKQMWRVKMYVPVYWFVQRTFFKLDDSFELHATHNYTIQKRQQYFFFWGIPLFPIKRYWCIRLENNKQFVLPSSMQALVKNIPGKIKPPPWYTLMLLWAVLLFLIGWCTDVYYSRWRNRQGHLKVVENRLNEIKHRMQNPKRGDFYIFEIMDDNMNKYDDSTKIAFRLRESNSDSVKLETVFNDLNKSRREFFLVTMCDEIFNDTARIRRSCWVTFHELNSITDPLFKQDFTDARMITSIDSSHKLLLHEIIRPEEDSY